MEGIRTGPLGRKLLYLLLAAAIAIAAGRTLGRRLVPLLAPEPLSLEAEALAAAYLENPVNGDRLYQNRLLELEGPISAIEKDQLGRPYILLKTVPAIRCYFHSGQEETLSRLRAGDRAVLSGLCYGYRPASPPQPAQIQLSDCLLSACSGRRD